MKYRGPTFIEIWVILLILIWLESWDKDKDYTINWLLSLSVTILLLGAMLVNRYRKAKSGRVENGRKG